MYSYKSPKLVTFMFMVLLSFPGFSFFQVSMDNTTFSFSSFSSENVAAMKLEGDATVLSNTVISLTKSLTELQNSNDGQSLGRAIYAKPMHLWDKASGHLADFSTHFSFAINSGGNTNKGIGFAFFLAPNGSEIPSTYDPAKLGLSGNNAEHKFVAVVFDTAGSYWDSSNQGDHLGIDINHLSSVRPMDWRYNDITEGGRIDAWINYISSSNNLSVVVINGDGTGSSKYTYVLYTIVDVRDCLPEWVTFGFSATASTNLYEKHEIYNWDFASSLQLHEATINQTILPKPTINETISPKPTISSGKRKSASKWLVRIVVVLGVTGTLVLVSGLVWFLCWRKKTKEDEETRPANVGTDNELEMKPVPRRFSHQELVIATNNFASERVLGRGGFGEVYAGELNDRNPKEIAVKKMTANTELDFKGYASEVNAISQLRHKNLVQLIGWCHEEQKLFIVYQYLPNKSLDLHLFQKQGQQSLLPELLWENRYKIAMGLASALLYLQEECEQCVLHRDIKPNNVLLDQNFNAKLGDFGLARLVEHAQGENYSSIFIGSEGYIAPEYRQTRVATKKSDIYSFGMVALEIACGKRAIHYVDDINGKKLRVQPVEWVWNHYGRGEIFAAADPILGQSYVEKEMKILLIVGLACAHPDCNNRPSIREAINMLNGNTDLPSLPSQMPPVPTNVAAQHATSASVSSTGGQSQSQSSGTNSSSQSSSTYITVGLNKLNGNTDLPSLPSQMLPVPTNVAAQHATSASVSSTGGQSQSSGTNSSSQSSSTYVTI